MKYLVLGNGFDLAHGLKTGYKDFLLYAIKRDKALYNNYTINNNLEVKYIETNNNEDDLYFRNKIKDNIWMSYFVVLYRDKKIRGENWIDFEMEISYIIEIFDRNAKSKLESISEMEEINNSDDNFHLFYKLYGIIYTHDQDGAKNRTYKELIEDLSNDLNDVILAFEYYLQNEVENVSVNIYSPDIKKIGRMDGILSFNYTTTAQRIYPTLSDVPIHYIHGKVSSGDNNMVLGVNEYWDEDSANIHTDFNVFKKFTQRVMKDTGVDYREWIYNVTNEGKRFENVRNTTYYNNAGLSEVYIFGHSLDISDKDLLEELFENKNIVVNIFYKDKVHQADLIAAIVRMISEKKFIEQYQMFPQRIKFIQQKEMENKTNGFL